MEVYKCLVCGYRYRPERGDAKNEIPPNTPFEKLPDSYRCPMCNEPKMAFVPDVPGKKDPRY